MITGWRAYKLNTIFEEEITALQGSHNQPWLARELVAECAGYSEPGEPGNKLIACANGAILELNEAQHVCFTHLTDKNDTYSYCGCGIYICKSLLQLENTSYSERLGILGQVTGYGAYQEYEEGWRVSHCRIESLWIDPNNRMWKKQGRIYILGLVVYLQEMYNVPVQVGWPQFICECGRAHFNKKWATGKGDAYKLCEMFTSHIVNAAKWLERMYSTNERKEWMDAFREELIYRAARRDEETGKLKIHF